MAFKEKPSEAEIYDIASQFGLPSDGVTQIWDFFSNGVSGHMSGRYLAHAIRAMEVFARNQRNLETFHIICKPVEGITPICMDLPRLRCVIYYPKNGDGQTKRMVIGHELGHLFFNILKEKKPDTPAHELQREKTASLFGLFLLHGRSFHYSTKEDSLRDKSWSDMAGEYLESTAILLNSDR